MPHSLRCRLQGLVYKGLLEKKDLERIVIIPKDATNGEIMEKVFGKEFAENIWLFYCKIDWWNAPYKKGEAK